MSKKKLNKKVWYSSEVDVSGNPILPPLADNPEDLEGLHEGELFLHNSDDYPSIWIRTKSGLIKPLIGWQSNTPSYWEVREFPNGDTYLYTSLPIVTQSGVTMYADGGNLNLPSIYDGLPIDNNTIYWENGILKAKGGGGVAESVSWSNITDKPSWLLDNKISYSEIADTPDLGIYVTETELTNKGYLTQHQDLSGYQKLITSSNKLAYSLISGTPTALKNPTALKFGTKSYDGSVEQTILASDLGALTSHQTIYTLTFQSGTFASGSFTANSGNKTINIPTTTSHISEGDNLYFTNARAVSALADTLKSYVTLSGTQTISGEKNFTGGLKVNGSPIVYDASKKYWKLEGDLLITGGLTMYGSDSSFTPSTIMDAIAVDGTTISKEGGVLRVIGGGSGSISEITKQMVIDALGFTPISSSDVPTALPNPHSLKFGSKLYDGSASKTILASDLGITWDDILGRPTLLSSFTDDVVAGKYLPLSGGTINIISDEGINVNRTNGTRAILSFKVDGGYKGGLGIDSDGVPFYRTYIGNVHTLLHSGNIGSQSVNYATSAGNADTLDGREGNGYTYHINGSTTVANKYIKIATLSASSEVTYDSVTISGTIGGWHSFDKADFKITVGRRDGVTFKGYSYPKNGWDIYVNDNGELLIYLSSLYRAWDLSVTCNQAVFDYKVDYTPTDTNFTKMSDSSYIVWFNNNGSVASATKLQTQRAIWGQSFDGSGNVSGILYYVDGIKGDGNGINIGLHPNRSLLKVAMTFNDRHDDAHLGELVYYSDHLIFGNYKNGKENCGICYYDDGRISLFGGNVGIGTTSPSAKLHIYGDVKAENGNFIGNLTGTAANAEKFAGVDFATFVSIIPTNTNQLENGAGFITSSGYSAGVTDYYDRTSNISISYQSSSLTASQIDYIAAYSTASGNIVIKDVDKSTMQSWLGLGSFAYKSSLAFSELTSKPTTISGYGITDAITTSNIGSQSVNYATSSGSCTGNAASATKLSDNTSFTIWGQEFFVNGKPKSVNGAFRLLREIPGTVVIHKALVYPTSPYGLITRAYIDGEISLQVQREDNDSECFNLALNPLGGNVGIGTISPLDKLHVAGNLRLKNEDSFYGNYIYFGDDRYCYIGETTDDSMTIYASKGIQLNGKVNIASDTTIDGNLLVRGGITMYKTDGNVTPFLIDVQDWELIDSMSVTQVYTAHVTTLLKEKVKEFGEDVTELSESLDSKIRTIKTALQNITSSSSVSAIGAALNTLYNSL